MKRIYGVTIILGLFIALGLHGTVFAAADANLSLEIRSSIDPNAPTGATSQSAGGSPSTSNTSSTSNPGNGLVPYSFFFAGYAYPGATVNITGDGRYIASQTANSSGSFQFSFAQTLKPGSHTYTIEETSASFARQSITLPVQVQSTGSVSFDNILMPPGINIQNNSTTAGTPISVQVKSVPNSSIYGFMEPADYGEIHAISGSDGTLVLQLPTNTVKPGSYAVRIRAISKDLLFSELTASNQSSAVTITAQASSSTESKQLTSLQANNIAQIVKAPRNLTQEQIVAARLVSTFPDVGRNQDIFPIINFITYATPSTQGLSLEDRFAMISSYRFVFSKFPKTTSDWDDVLAMSHGVRPIHRNLTLESRAQRSFTALFGRAAKSTDTADQFMITILTYGVHVVPLNASQYKPAVAAYQRIFGRKPSGQTAAFGVEAIQYYLTNPLKNLKLR